MQAVQNAFLAPRVIKKISMGYSVVSLAFWLAHDFAFDTYLDCCSPPIPLCCIDTRLISILFKQETHNHNQFAPKYPSCHDPDQKCDLQGKLYLQNKMKINIYTIKIIFQTCFSSHSNSSYYSLKRLYCCTTKHSTLTAHNNILP